MSEPPLRQPQYQSDTANAEDRERRGVEVLSGPPGMWPGLDFAFGCVCGAIWNTNVDEKPKGKLCGPLCMPELTKISG